MKNLLSVIFTLISAFVFSQAPVKSFPEKLDGIKTGSKELTKSSATDNSSIGQTGALNTSVPIVTVSSRTMSFPLQLQYSSGITTDQNSGPVGLGWALPVGSIVRDYGAYEPDYTATSSEADMINSNPGSHTGWMEMPGGVSVNPSLNNQYLGYDAIKSQQMSTPISDKYHVNVPNFLSNSFWNAQKKTNNIDHLYDWKVIEYERWKIAPTYKTFSVSQEFSRINELNNNVCGTCLLDKGQFDEGGSYAAAIGMLPYVINGKIKLPISINSSDAWIPCEDCQKVQYEDFDSFSITDESGKVFVFGRPLRGQKFVYSDDPYWSTGGTYADVPTKGNFWKIDYIAEWLLTEIRSVDYVDQNGNGIADDGDGGDWIKFEYTQPTKTEKTVLFGSSPSAKMDQEVPMHRTWNSFSQTDQASSLMREVAYLTRIVTPTQIVDLTISKRMDVEHDFYSKPANRVGSTFYYADRKYHSQGSSEDFDIQFPVETMKYDEFKIYSRLINKSVYPSENSLLGSVRLNYAEKGSAEELAVSSFLIRDNDNNDKHVGQPRDQNAFNIMSYNSNVKRGKTTLVGIDFLNSEEDQTDISSYKFEYGFNPSFNEHHKREIARNYFFPSLRQSNNGNYLPNPESESFQQYTESLYSSNTLTTHSQILPSDFLIDFPYNESLYRYPNSQNFEAQNLVENGNLPTRQTVADPISHLLKPVKDVYGYYYAEGCTDCAKAWSLSKITFPTGGSVEFEYEPGTFAKSVDNAAWETVKENNIPVIRDYNLLAAKRCAAQHLYNLYSKIYFGSELIRDKQLTAAYEVSLPENVGVRIKKKIINDKINPVVQIDFTYGTGHMTSLPASYVSNYIQGFNSFIMREQLRHDWEKNHYPTKLAVDLGAIPLHNDYMLKMKYAAISNITLDNYFSTHFYEFVTTSFSDGSKQTSRFGTLPEPANPLTDQSIYLKHNLFCTRLPSANWDGRFVLAGNSLINNNIVLKKTENYEAGITNPYQSETYVYSDQVIGNPQKVQFNFGSNPVYHTWNAPGATCSPQNLTSSPTNLVLWNNTFELWLTIKDNITPKTYYNNNPSIVTGPMFGPYLPPVTWTNNGSSDGQNLLAFVYDAARCVVASCQLTYAAGENNYVNWGVYKRTLNNKVTSYKGLTTTTSYTYSPTDFHLVSEYTAPSNVSESYLTTYEFANETYTSATNVFSSKNCLNLITRKNKYLGNTANNANTVSAEMTTYDYSSGIPRAKNQYDYLASSLNANGTFSLAPYTIGGTNTNWKIAEQSFNEYNLAGIPVGSKKDLLFSKTVLTDNLGFTKASFASPERKFDAAYIGFDDISDPLKMAKWNSQSYLQEDLFTGEEKLETIPAYVYTASANASMVNICDNATSYTVTYSNPPSTSIYTYQILTNDVSKLVPGAEVTLDYSSNSGSTWQHIPLVVTYVKETSGIPSAVSPKNYLVCFTTSTVPAIDMAIRENASITISSPLYRVSGSYSRTGSYSYKLPTIRTTQDLARKTPLRPVKIYSLPVEDGCNIPQGPGDENSRSTTIPEQCYLKYEASVWLKYDTDIPSVGTNPPATLRSSEDNTADAIYKRGEVSTSVNQGVKIICDVWNSTRTQIQETKIFYAIDLNKDWKQFTVEMPLLKGSEKWLDVYVLNEIAQPNAPVSTRKSVFVEDILVYPQGSRYQYSVYDARGNQIQNVNNNDVISTTLYDSWGRPTGAKNVYGSVISETSYFNHPNWSSQNNHITEKAYIEDGMYSLKRTYLDGFGKEKQVMLSDLARNTRMVASTMVYNNRGRVSQSYKPYALSGSAFSDKFDGNYASRTQTLYGSPVAYSEVAYEAKPEEAIAATYAPRQSAESPIVNSRLEYVSTSDLQDPANYVYTAGSLLILEMTDPAGNKKRSYTDNLGRMVMEEHEIGNLHSQQNDGSILFTSTAITAARTWYFYDVAGRIKKVTDPDGKESTYTYNSLGQLLKSVSPDKGTSEVRYDKYGRVRFTRGQKDIDAVQANNFGTDQFKYSLYDVWGMPVESGMIACVPNTAVFNPASPPFTAYIFFNDPAYIEDQLFPNAAQKLKQKHNAFEYGNSRIDFNTSLLITEKTYSGHALNSLYNFIPTAEDIVTYSFMADGQPATTSYTYQGLPGTHKFKAVYNAYRIPVGKEYIHPTDPAKNFKWKNTLDAFGRPVTNSSVYNSLTTQTGKNYYDVTGNLLMTGLGATGITADPHTDYIAQKFDIRDQLISRMSNNFRFGLKYNAAGNITDQVWSNERFDATSNAASVNINQYTYSYDKMNRLVGADYRNATMTSNPFAYFNSVSASFPNDFNCSVIARELEAYLQPIYDGFRVNISNNEYVDWSTQSLNAINLLQSLYERTNIAYSTMTETEQDQLYSSYLSSAQRSRIDVLSYEWFTAETENDEDHLTLLKNTPRADLTVLKYTKRLLSRIPFTPATSCIPNPSSTVYGFLPAFPSPATVTSTKYDAAYWYTKNGNFTALNRNDNNSIKTQQAYTYGNSLNNKLTGVSWTAGPIPPAQSPTPVTTNSTYSYDAVGNLTSDMKNQISSIKYTAFTDLPVSITNASGERTYRYSASQQRTVKEISANDREYYLDGVILNQAGNVKSYQTAEGYAVPNTVNGTVDYFYNVKDWLGTTRCVIAANGIVVNASDNYPYGKRLPGRNYSGDVEGNRYRFTGHEFDGETGYEYHGARYYNEDLARYMSVDPWAYKYSAWSTYNYTMSNPVKFVDPTGKGVESTIVTESYNGTYKVIGGNTDDNDNGIYIDNGSGGKGKLIGYSATPESFYYSETKEWQGNINPNNQSGRNFLNNLIKENPTLVDYMTNATSGKKYDFKRTNGKNEIIYDTPLEHYRGMPILEEKNGKPIFASGRDIGNIAAGYIAGKEGLGWGTARLGFDALETLQYGAWTTESTSTQYAQKLGHNIGYAMYEKFVLGRLPGNGHLTNKTISKDVIKKGDL